MSHRVPIDDPGRVALRAGRAVVPLEADVLRLDGADTLAYLQTKLTADTRGWATTGGGRAVATDINGRVIASGWFATADASTVYAVVPSGAGADLATHLDRFVIMEDVTIAVDSSVRSLLAVGSDASACAEHIDGAIASCSAPHGRWPCRLVVVSRDDAEPALGQLVACGAERVTTQALDAEEVAAGVPSDAVELGPGASIPLEAGAYDRIAFDKGCYLGQEVIERLHSRGTPARRLCRIAAIAEPGDEVVLDGRTVGQITRVADGADGPVALAWIKRRGLADEAVLRVGDAGVAEVSVIRLGDDAN